MLEPSISTDWDKGYCSIWICVIALGGALAGFLVGQGLDLYGYVPDVLQTARSMTGIRLLIGVLPSFFIIAANLVLGFYPLNKKRYEQVLLKIKEMESGKES